MSEIIENIKEELIKRCVKYDKKYNYDFWNNHIKYVVKNAVELAKKYEADVEIVELGALLHDIAIPSEIGPKEEHNIYGKEIADELLTKLNYPKDRKEKVKECVLRHRGSKELPRNTIEEQCVADADVIAHFDCIPMLFHLVYNEMNLSVEDGETYLKKKLERDYNKLSDRTRKIVKDRYENIINILFVNK
ncbi:MAG: HD domain-containing protein [Clostridia bacterium]|nr:HD domain-containing protein [Clostridia bacterium]